MKTDGAKFSDEVIRDFRRLTNDVVIERSPRAPPCSQGEGADNHIGQPEFDERVDKLEQVMLKTPGVGATIWHDGFSLAA